MGKGVKKKKTRRAGDSDVPQMVLPNLTQHFRTGREGDTLQSEQVRLLYSNLPSSIIISAVLALVLAVVQASVIASDLLYGWCALLGVVLVSRFVLFSIWRRYSDAAKERNTRLWLLLFRISTIIAGIVWGVGGILLAPSGDAGHKIYVSFVLAGLSAGAATTLAIDRITVTGFLCFVLVPQVIFLATEGDKVSLGMSAMDALFLLFLLSSAHQSRRQLEENFFLRKKATENESQMRQILESSPVATHIADVVSDQVLFANSSYISLIDSTPDQVTSIISSCYYAHPEMCVEVVERLGKGEHISSELVELRSCGEEAWTKWVLASYFPVEYQEKPALLSWFYDITDRKLTQDEIEYMAYHDTLTGLPNRSLFLDRLQKAILRADRESDVLAVMFIDLDKFKPVNDQHGHNIGDLLLKAVAKRIADGLRKSDSAARIGGDEFVVLLLSVDSDENAMIVAEKVRLMLNEPFEIEGLSLEISATIGVSLYPSHSEKEQELMKLADIAMYYAKADGRNCVRIYEKAMREA